MLAAISQILDFAPSAAAIDVPPYFETITL